MPNFKYTARDLQGRGTSGQIEAADATELRRILRANDLYLVHHRGGGKQAAGNEGQSAKPSIFDAKPKLQDMVIAIRQLSTMIRSGVPIAQAIVIVGSQSNKPALRLAFTDIEKLVTEGQPISLGMRRYPKVFNPLVVSLTEAGETAGTLEQTLEIAAMQLDREDTFRRKVKAATFYPKMVVLAAAGTVAVMLTVVVPVFAQVYGSLNAKLPAATLLLISSSNFVTKYWWVVLGMIIATTYAFRKYRATPGGGLRLDIIALKLPVVGPVMRKIAIARFVQTLSGALRGGVGVLHAMVISGQTAGNCVIRDAVINSAHAVRDGSTIAEELTKTGEFPIMVTRMIAAGEASGNVDNMLDEINVFYDRDVEYSVDQLTRMIEPLMTVLVGGIVLLVLLGLYMPIFSLGKAFQGAGK